jgi:cation:H+ antiporter
LLVSLLTLPLLAGAMPPVTIFGVHPISLVLVASYALGVRLLTLVRDAPMWMPVRTSHTQDEAAQAAATDDRRTTPSLWRWFVLYASLTAVGGFVIGETAGALVDRTSLSQSAVGTVFAAIATSLPELVTAIAAVRRGALNLAVGDVIGGNAFEVLFLGAADVAYRGGSIYHQFTAANRFTTLLAILMTGVLLLGMLRRERHGIAGIGFESALVLLLYVGGVVMLLV